MLLVRAQKRVKRKFGFLLLIYFLLYLNFIFLIDYNLVQKSVYQNQLNNFLLHLLQGKLFLFAIIFLFLIIFLCYINWHCLCLVAGEYQKEIRLKCNLNLNYTLAFRPVLYSLVLLNIISLTISWILLYWGQQINASLFLYFNYYKLVLYLLLVLIGIGSCLFNEYIYLKYRKDLLF